MKKVCTIFTVVILTTTISLAQDLTSKKGENYLPEGDEWSIGFDATSLLNYLGNFIGNADASNTAPTVQSPNFTGNGATFYGKKMIDDNSAWRGGIEFGFGSSSVSTFEAFSYDYTTYDVDNEQVDNDGYLEEAGEVETDTESRDVSGINKETTSSSGYTLWLGKEFRRGTTRLQGIYGAEAGVGFRSSKVTMEYEIDHSLYAQAAGEDVSRDLVVKDGSTFSLGARVFIGAEYFILPKISLAAEYGWGLGLTSTGKGSVTTENTEVIDGQTVEWEFAGTYNGAPTNPGDEVQIGPDTYITTEEKDDGDTSSGSFGIGNDLRGSISVTLYF